MRHNSASISRWILKATIVILWLFAVVAAYFWAHKPFNTGILAGLGRTLSSVAVWCALTWLGAALVFAGREIVPDLLLWRDAPRLIARHARRLLTDEKLRTRTIEDLTAVKHAIDSPGASRRAAEVILDIARTRRTTHNVPDHF